METLFNFLHDLNALSGIEVTPFFIITFFILVFPLNFMFFGILPFPLIVRTPFFNVEYTPLCFTAALACDAGNTEQSIAAANVTAKIFFDFLIIIPPDIKKYNFKFAIYLTSYVN
jgi:hypothetical protein